MSRLFMAIVALLLRLERATAWMKRWLAIAALLTAGILGGWQSSRCEACGVFRERQVRTPAQQQAWQRHQQQEWEWNNDYDRRDFQRCLLKHGYDKCMGRSY